MKYFQFKKKKIYIAPVRIWTILLTRREYGGSTP